MERGRRGPLVAVSPDRAATAGWMGRRRTAAPQHDRRGMVSGGGGLGANPVAGAGHDPGGADRHPADAHPLVDRGGAAHRADHRHRHHHLADGRRSSGRTPGLHRSGAIPSAGPVGSGSPQRRDQRGPPALCGGSDDGRVALRLPGGMGILPLPELLGRVRPGCSGPDVQPHLPAGHGQHLPGDLRFHRPAAGGLGPVDALPPTLGRGGPHLRRTPGHPDCQRHIDSGHRGAGDRLPAARGRAVGPSQFLLLPDPGSAGLVGGGLQSAVRRTAGAAPAALPHLGRHHGFPGHNQPHRHAGVAGQLPGAVVLESAFLRDLHARGVAIRRHRAQGARLGA